MSKYEKFNSEKFTYEGEHDPVISQHSHHHQSIWQNDDFRAHLSTFVVINTIMFIIDFFTGTGLTWFMYPLISWGIGLSIQFWSTLFEMKIHTPLKRDLYIHAAVEGTLICFFFLLDFFTGNRLLSWYIYPSLPLAFAWFCHYGAYRYRHPNSGHYDDEQLSSRYNRLFIKEKFHLGKEDSPRIRHLARQIVLAKLSIGIHSVVYFAAVGFFLAINLFTNPHNLWFYWPVLPWGLGLLEHVFGSTHKMNLLRGKKVSKWYNLLYPGGVCLFLTAIDAFSDGSLSWYIYPTIAIMGLAAFVIALVKQPKAQPILKPIDRIISNFTSIGNQIKSGIEVEVTIDNLNEDEDRPQKSSKRRFCAKCGGPIENKYKFCEYCGSKVRNL